MYNMNEVLIFKCNSYDENDIKEVVSKLTTSFNVLNKIKKGSKVVIKANLVSAMNPDKNATTNPILLKGLVTYLLEKNCEVVIGDSPSGLFNELALNKVYKATGMEVTGATLNNNFSTKKVYFSEAKVLKSFEYTSYIDDADIKINFCKLKTHGMMNMSCSVKNLFGTIPGTLKPEYHYRFPKIEDFANMLIDINEYFKFDLNIVDAIDGMEGNGPTMGDPRHIGCVLCSTNPYALDDICSKLINLNSLNVETIKQSRSRGLYDYNNISTNIPIKDIVIKDFKLNSSLASLKFYSNSNNPFAKIVSIIAKKVFYNQPDCKKKKCIGCGKCSKICPAKAITMKNGKPSIDRSKCIKCYCCQEFCPIGAMHVKSSLIARIIKKH